MKRNNTNRPPKGDRSEGFPIKNPILIDFDPFGLILFKNYMILYENETGIVADTPRIFLKVILTSKQHSKVQIWTSKLKFQFSHPSKISVFLHNSTFKSKKMKSML